MKWNIHDIKLYVILSISMFCVGMLMCASYYEWIIIRSPLSIETLQKNNTNAHKKEIVLSFWKHETWLTEKHAILWSHDTAQNITLLLTALLNVLDDEHILDKKIRIESVCLSPSKQDAYISFDHTLFNQNMQVYEKWHLIESFLKTMKENDINVQNIHFLVYHEPLHDYHLDFNNPWPLHGFLHQEST